MGERSGVTGADPASLGVSSAPPADIPGGSLVDRYVVLEALGKGGMGDVYSAYDPKLDRRVALKLLRRAFGQDLTAERRERLLREGQTMARLSHPNVVTVYDLGIAASGQVFLTMEYVQGGTLRDWLAKRERTWREIVRLMCEAGEGLAAAHEAGIVHRDFKLDNVLIDLRGRPKVTDFGLAHAGPQKPPQLAASAERLEGGPPVPPSPFETSTGGQLTVSSATLGTPGYMAPEQYEAAARVDGRADIFAFCASLYRALYGHWAFKGETLEEVANSTLTGQMRPVQPGSKVPPWVHAVLLRGLSTDRESRPGSMAVLLAALRADPSKRRLRWLAVGVVVAGASVAALGVHAAGQRRARACLGLQARIDGAWDAPRKLAVAGAFRATGLPYAESTWGKVDHALDTYASRWVDSAQQACIAARVRREQSEATYELRTACLDEHLDALRALTDVLAAADAKAVEGAAKAVHDLPPIERCSNLDRLSLGARWPTDTAARAEVRSLQAEVAAARALDDSGKTQLVVDRLLRIRERVERSGYGPLLVSWRLVKAGAERSTDARAAEEDAEEAAVLADSFRLDEAKAEACLRLVQLNVTARTRRDEARMWQHLAAGAIARLGGDARLEIQLGMDQAWIDIVDGGDGDLFRRVLDRARDAGMDDPILRANAHDGMAQGFLNQGRLDDTIDEGHEAVRQIEEAYGAGHPKAVYFLVNLAAYQSRAGRLVEALESASSALSILDAGAQRGDVAAESNRRGFAQTVVGLVRMRLGRAREALDHFTRARDQFRAGGNSHSLFLLQVDVDMAEAQRLLGHGADAERTLDEAESIVRELPELRPLYVAVAYSERAKVDLEKGATDAAASLAERALALEVEDRGTEPYVLADTRLTLARALDKRGQTPDRVRALAQQARDGFATLHDSSRVQEVTAFLGALR
jgi:tetratricopeptide (TPR) repeat protein